MIKGVIFNEDQTEFIFQIAKMKNMRDYINEETCRAYINLYKDSTVTDYFINVGGMMSAYPSKVKCFYSDRLKETYNGKPIEDTDRLLECADILWNEKKLDLFKIWIDECNKININPWLSFRMNDCHCLFDEGHYLVPNSYSDYYEEHSRIRHRRQIQYFDRTRDYELEVIRNEELAYIDEALGRYDAYGIELDFQREMYCFAPGHEQNGISIMNEFMDNVKEIVKKYETKYSHKIKIAVRALANPLHCIDAGFDIQSWAKKDNIDLYIASPRFNNTDTDIPIYLWKELLSPYGVEVAGAVDRLINENVRMWDDNTVETTFGIANTFFSEGADKVYLFNCFVDFLNECPAELNNPYNTKGRERLLKSLGDNEKLLRETRKNVVSYVDTLPVGHVFFSTLPITSASTDSPIFVRIKTGNIISDTKVMLELGIKEENISEKDISVFINSASVKYIGVSEIEKPILTDSVLFIYEVPFEALSERVQMLEILPETKGVTITLDYAAIKVVQ